MVNGEKLQNILAGISSPDTSMEKAAKARLDSLSKPLGSLGRLEEIVVRLAGISGRLFPSVQKKNIIIMCSDNGVVEEGICQAPKSVTSLVTRNFTKGITGINVLADHCGSDITVVDIGVDDDINLDGIINRKIRKGTYNIAKGPAMTKNEAERAILEGVEIVKTLKEKGYQLLGTGEMGIGNTTTSSAVTAVLTGYSPEEMVGRGAGLSNEGLELKINVVSKAIRLNSPDRDDPIDVLAKLGGFDIAGLVGCFIGAAACKLPILIDGFISSAAALLAYRLHSGVKDYLFPSHCSAEPGSIRVMEALGFTPYLNLSMRLGEGTGAALGFHIIDAAVAAYSKMGTFGDANIEQYVPLDK